MKADRDQNTEVALARKRQEEAMRINLLREQAQRGGATQVHVGSSASAVEYHLISIPGATTESTEPTTNYPDSNSTGTTNSADAATSTHATAATIAAASGPTTS